MVSGKPVVVHNLYDWLPGHGESGAAIRSEGKDWIVTVSYDDPSSSCLCKREIRFRSTWEFCKAGFPGAQVFASALKMAPLGATLGALCEFPDSDAAAAWNKHLQSSRPGIRINVKHYLVVFLAENIVLNVLSEGFSVSDPLVLPNA